MAAGRAHSRQDACTLDGCAGCCAKCGADAPALHARRHGGSSRNGMPDGTMRCTATCSELAAIMGVSPARLDARRRSRSEEHTSELQSLMRISYAVFCLKK